MKELYTYPEIIAKLYALANPEVVTAKQEKFGVVANGALGIYQKDLNALLKHIPKDNTLALQLFESGIYEARILCSKLFKPKQLTIDLAETWAATFDNWEICDSFCLFVFAKSSLAIPLIEEWTQNESEFIKRAGFATMAAFCHADKYTEDTVFEQFFPVIIQEATDKRVYVKKATNWALRGIGKRNIKLKAQAIACAEHILTIDNPTARWIATDALKELQGEKVRISNYPRSVYGT